MKTTMPCRSTRSVAGSWAFSFALPLVLASAPAAPARAETPTPAVLDSTLRFRNDPIVSAVTDVHRVPRPAVNPFDRSAYYFDAYLGRRAVRSLSPTRAGRAGGVNALDEVPDGSWFENRIGVGRVSPDELIHRSVPPPRLPFTVMGSKVGGVSLGMRVRDANGAGFLLKFDRPGDPDSETASDVVVQRLLWAVGYHTPEDAIVFFRRADLRMDPKASLKDAKGVSRRMTDQDLAGMLSHIDRRPDGSYRGLTSRLLAGAPVGGFPQEGVREDHANDVTPHGDRRDVRGARIFFSWLNNADVKEDNTLDMWIEDPRTPGRGTVRHHQVDFGNSLGVFAWEHDQSIGFSQGMDYGHGARALVSFGLWKRPWEDVRSSPLRGVGNFESALFDPVQWRPRYPWAPFERFDRFDGGWGARILMQVSPAHIAAAVSEGHYQDAASAAYITRTLIERQRKIGWHYLTQTSPLERFSVSAGGPAGNSICFDDPLLIHFAGDDQGLRTTTRHRIATWDFAGHPLPLRVERAGADRVCVDGITLGASHDGYTIVDIETARPGIAANRMLVHIALDPASHLPRVIGLRRL
jgi:hypothetical protein